VARDCDPLGEDSLKLHGRPLPGRRSRLAQALTGPSTHPQLGKGRIVGAKTTNLRAFALSLVGDRADDLVQDTLLRALQKQDRFEPGTNLQAWVFTLMRNLFYSEYRKRKREVEDVNDLFAAKLSTLPEQPGRVEFAELRCALAQLSDEQREAVLLIGAEGFSYEETAVICGTAVGTIKSRVNRARKRLAELLGHEHDSDIGPDGVTHAALGLSMGTMLA
jgi:RNA polymerase sigma-70 factor, ECF subfamily